MKVIDEKFEALSKRQEAAIVGSWKQKMQMLGMSMILSFICGTAASLYLIDQKPRYIDVQTDAAYIADGNHIVVRGSLKDKQENNNDNK